MTRPEVSRQAGHDVLGTPTAAGLVRLGPAGSVARHEARVGYGHA